MAALVEPNHDTREMDEMRSALRSLVFLGWICCVSIHGMLLVLKPSVSAATHLCELAPLFSASALLAKVERVQARVLRQKAWRL